MQIIVTDGSDERFVALCRELDATLNQLVGGEEQRRQYIQYNSPHAVTTVLLLLENTQAVACCGMKAYDSQTAEIKRVFTKPACQGRGYARMLLTALENQALSQGYKHMILETGRKLHAAYRLYSALGFQVIENYGQYRDMPDSICMQKSIHPA